MEMGRINKFKMNGGIKMNNDFIEEVDDGIDVVEMRELLEMTREMVRCINREEFNEILMIYNKAIERLSKD